MNLYCDVKRMVNAELIGIATAGGLVTFLSEFTTGSVRNVIEDMVFVTVAVLTIADCVHIARTKYLSATQLACIGLLAFVASLAACRSVLHNHKHSPQRATHTESRHAFLHHQTQANKQENNISLHARSRAAPTYSPAPAKTHAPVETH